MQGPRTLAHLFLAVALAGALASCGQSDPDAGGPESVMPSAPLQSESAPPGDSPAPGGSSAPEGS